MSNPYDSSITEWVYSRNEAHVPTGDFFKCLDILVTRRTSSADKQSIQTNIFNKLDDLLQV